MLRMAPLLIFLSLVPALQSRAQEAPRADSYYHFALAKVFHFQGDYEKAIAEFEKALQAEPNNGRIHLEFAETLFKDQKINRAISECKEAIKADPKSDEAHFLLGQIYQVSNLRDKAEEEYQTVVKLNPDHFEAYYYLGQLFLMGERFQEAADAYQHCIDLRPAVVMAHYRKALALINLNRPHEAIEVLEDSVKVNPQPENMILLGDLYEKTHQTKRALEIYHKVLAFRADPNVQLKIAELLGDQKHFDEAIPILRDLAARAPENLKINLELGKTLIQAGRYKEAVPLLKELVSKNKENLEARLTLAKALRGDNQLEEAKQAYESVLSRDSNNLAANFELSQVMSQLGEYDDAIERLQHLIKIGPEPAAREIVRRQLALVYLRIHRYDQGIPLLKKVIHENPSDSPDDQLILVSALSDAGKRDEALQLSAELLKARPNDADVIATRANVLSRANRLREAVDLLRKHWTLKPNRMLFLFGGVIYTQHHRYSDAEKVVREGLKRWPGDESLEFQLGEVYERAGEVSPAEKQFKKVLERNPDHTDVLNYLGYMLADRGVRLQEALSYIKKALAIDPYNGAYLDSLGWVYFKLGELKEAEKNLLLASKINSTDATIFEHLGDLYSKMGNLNEAEKFYKLSLTYAGPDDQPEEVRQKLTGLENRKLKEEN